MFGICYILCGIPMSGFAAHGMGFSAHGFLIPVLELEFWSLVETLYCIVNILYNAMKETKRVNEAKKASFFLRGFQGNLCVFVCESHCVMFHFS